MNKHPSFLCYPVAFLLAILSAPAIAADGLYNSDPQGRAIHGYDAVAYFSAGKAVAGLPALSYPWSGATWLFASAENRRAFIENPQRYAPQFGGYCAYAASYGQLADVDPQAWSILNDKLYLNFSARVRQTWRPRAQEFIQDAEQLWPQMQINE